MFTNREHLSRVEVLDNEIEKIFLENLEVIVKEFPLSSRFYTELRYFLKVFLWTNSMLARGSTYGQDVLSLKFTSSLTQKQLAFHFTLNILGPYLKEMSALNFPGNSVVQKGLRFADLLGGIFGLLNFFRFMKSGHAYSLSEYFLGLKQTSHSPIGSVGYYYLNLELMWAGFLELLNVTVPLTKYYKHKMAQKQSNDGVGLKRITEKCDLVNFNKNSKCALCNERICIPYRSNCCHAFCYICLAGAESVGNNCFYCPACKNLQPKDEIVPIILSSGSQ